MSNFEVNYEKILETLKQIESKMNFLNQIRKPKLSDIELIVIDLTAKHRGIYSERDLFRKLPFDLTSKIERSVYIAEREICLTISNYCVKICKENHDTSYCASQKSNFYGYKLHAVCTIDGLFSGFDLTHASIHDIHFLKDIKHIYHNCTMLGDKAYLSIDYQKDLSHPIKLNSKFL